MRQDQIDDRVFDLYDEYCHGHIDRRQFFERATQLTVGTVSAVAMAAGTAAELCRRAGNTFHRRTNQGQLD